MAGLLGIRIRALRRWRCSPALGNLVRLAPGLGNSQSIPAWQCNLHSSLSWLHPTPGKRPITTLTKVSVPTDQDLGLGPGSRMLQGRYLTGKVLGQGGFGVVLAGRDVDTGEVVAIKVLRKDYFTAAPGRRVQRLKREIAAVTRFKHPYITRLLELLHDRVSIYLVMEFVAGGDLKSRMKYAGCPFPEDDARRLFQHIIDALDFCHGKGVLHRDIKPSNVLMAANGDAKLCDFGLAELLGDEYSSADGRIRTAGGTLPFLAPEALSAPPTGYEGAPVDVWACGCTLYALATGQSPFSHVAGDDRDRIMKGSIYAGYYVTPSYVSKPLADLIRRCIEPDVDRRITIPEIYKHRWFATKYKPPDFTQIQDIKTRLDDMEAAFGPHRASRAPSGGAPGPSRSRAGHKPRRLDAFELLAQAPGFDVAPFIQNPTDPYARDMRSDLTRFTSLLPAQDILDTIQDACVALGFTAQVLDFKMMVREATAGRKEPLCLSVEVAKVAAGAFMVEVRRVTGGPEEYRQFLEDFTAAIEDKIARVPGPADQS